MPTSPSATCSRWPSAWPTRQTHTRLPQFPLRMGPKLDSATFVISAALSGYAYAYRSAWRFS
jgi:hypothetical protein